MVAVASNLPRFTSNLKTGWTRFFASAINSESNLSNLSNLFCSHVRGCARACVRRASRAPANIHFRLDRLDRLDLRLIHKEKNAANLRKVCGRLDANCWRLDAMDWKPAVGIRQESADGYSLTAIRGAAGWKFSAWGPDKAPGWSYRDFANGLIPHWAGDAHKAHYALGEQIPQRFELLGCCESAEAARALCEAHAAAIGG